MLLLWAGAGHLPHVDHTACTRVRHLLPPLPSQSQVVAPYDSEDARGLLKAAVRDPDPVRAVESHGARLK